MMTHQFLADAMPPARAERLLIDWVNLPDKGRPRFFAGIVRLTKLYPEVFGRSETLAPDIQLMISSVSIHLKSAWDAPDSRDREWYVFRLREIYGQFAERVLFPSFSSSEDNRLEGGIELEEQVARAIRERFGNIVTFLKSPHIGSYAASTRIHPQADIDISQPGRSDVSSAAGSQRELLFVHAWTETWSESPKGPPAKTPFEEAAFRFHRISARARHCSNPECQNPYFLATRKGQKYCGQKCAAAGERESKRLWWDKNKDRVRPRSKTKE